MYQVTQVTPISVSIGLRTRKFLNKTNRVTIDNATVNQNHMVLVSTVECVLCISSFFCVLSSILLPCFVGEIERERGEMNDEYILLLIAANP